ncbi:MAG: FadR/GntR family transcriptional regulator [Burkholderiaceae bacterium]|nr:FadR/GntR family transcriptional regulator [Burkholderiaceae bacterium]
MPIQSIEPQRLYRQIADQLRQLIAKGEFVVGNRLPAERDLAKQLGVSRPSVREALIALEVEGWVEVRTGSGIYVLDRGQYHAINNRAVQATNTPANVENEGQGELLSKAEWGPLELIRARRVVEGETAAIAALQAKRKDIDAMGKALRMMQTEAADGVLPLDGDRAFHTAIVQASGNEVLIDTVQSFWDSRRGPIFGRLVGYFETLQSWQAAIAEHSAILDAIQAHDAAAARIAMHAHMDKSHARFSASWRKAKVQSSI